MNNCILSNQSPESQIHSKIALELFGKDLINRACSAKTDSQKAAWLGDMTECLKQNIEVMERS